MNHSDTSSSFRRLQIVSACGTAFAFLAAPEAMGQQPCNPAIDGTYCATAGIKKRPELPSTGSGSNAEFSAISSAGFFSAVSGAGFYEQPATLGAITFGSSGRCIGLVRRVNCK
jgi:hypothetical protein